MMIIIRGFFCVCVCVCVCCCFVFFCFVLVLSIFLMITSDTLQSYQVFLLSLFYRWENWITWGVNELPKGKELGFSWTVLSPKSEFLTTRVFYLSDHRSNLTSSSLSLSWGPRPHLLTDHMSRAMPGPAFIAFQTDPLQCQQKALGTVN